MIKTTVYLLLVFVTAFISTCQSRIVYNLTSDPVSAGLPSVHPYPTFPPQELHRRRRKRSALCDDVRCDVEKVTLPQNFDWAAAGYIKSPLEGYDDVGGSKCRSSWALAAAEAIEVAWERAKCVKGQRVDPGKKCNQVGSEVKRNLLNAKELVDCVSDVLGAADAELKDKGCEFGWPHLGWEYLLRYRQDIGQTGGLITPFSPDKDVDNKPPPKNYSPYFYGPPKTFKCLGAVPGRAAKFHRYWQLGVDDYEIMEHVFLFGPVTATLNPDYARLFSSQNAEFILESESCRNSSAATEPLHHVLIVGYGTQARKDFWLVKNYFGPSWGAQGFGKILRNKNLCGINDNVFLPWVDFRFWENFKKTS